MVRVVKGLIKLWGNRPSIRVFLQWGEEMEVTASPFSVPWHILPPGSEAASAQGNEGDVAKDAVSIDSAR